MDYWKILYLISLNGSVLKSAVDSARVSRYTIISIHASE